MKYYYIENGAQVGPFEVSELYNKGIRPETLVWCDTMENWTPAWQVAELRSVIDSSIVRREPPKYNPNGNDGSAEAPLKAKEMNKKDKKERQRSGCGMRSLVALLILVLLGGVLVFTCPDRQAHQAAIKQEFNAAMSEKMGSSNGIIESVIQLGSKYMMGMAAESALNELLTVDNYFICSVGRMEFDGREHVTSIGLLNHIFTVNKDDIIHALDRAEQAARDIKNDNTSDGDVIGTALDLLRQWF